MKEYLCPNCKQPTKIQEDKKYHDCDNCKHEFKLEDAPLYESNQAKPSESIFGKALKELAKTKGEKNERHT